MDTTTSLAFFEQLELPTPHARRVRRDTGYSAGAPSANDNPGAPEAGIQQNKLVAFTSGLDIQYKEAVKYSIQIAQATADARFDQLTERLEWYALYSHVMAQAGWISGTNRLAEYRHANLEITMEAVAIELIKLAAGPNAATVAELANLAIDSLKGDTQLTRQLQVASTKGRAGAFDILPCLHSDGDVVMYDHAMRFEHSSSSGGFWFWSWEAKDVSLHHVANARTLNFSHYQAVERSIKAQLSETSNDFFSNLKLN